jgi:hypothetical protein
MRKLKVVSSANFVGKKKRHLQDYFDNDPGLIMTPNQRSVPKKKSMFGNKSKGKSNKK